MTRSSAEREGLSHVWERAFRIACPTCRMQPGVRCRKAGDSGWCNLNVIHDSRWRLAGIAQRLVDGRRA